MSATVAVTTKSASKDTKDQKDATKEPSKEQKDLKDQKDGQKEANKDTKDSKDRKDSTKESKERWKERKDNKDSREWFWWSSAQPSIGAAEQAPFDAPLDQLAALEARVRLLEEALGLSAPTEPFIDSSMRPDLTGGPSYGAGGQSLQQRMAAGDRDAKLEYDNKPPASGG